MTIIINNFYKFPLKTKKKSDYELWKQVINKIKNKEHLTKDGLWKIIAIKASMNQGLSEKLKLAFPNIMPMRDL